MRQPTCMRQMDCKVLYWFSTCSIFQESPGNDTWLACPAELGKHLMTYSSNREGQQDFKCWSDNLKQFLSCRAQRDNTLQCQIAEERPRVERDGTFLLLCRQGLVPGFFELISPESQHNNVNSLRVCQLLLEARALTPADIKTCAVVEKVRHVPVSIVSGVQGIL